MATPRADSICVFPEALKQAEGFVNRGGVREAIVIMLEAQAMQVESKTASLPPLLVDGGGLVHSCFCRLREDPWLALSLNETSSPGDKEVKAAFRGLALKFHPDKNQRKGSFDTTALFATLYSAYETLGSASSRAAFVEQRERERLERLAASATGGRKGVEEVEKRHAKARVKREQEALAKWRAQQTATVERWVGDDRAAAACQQEREHANRTRARLEKERRSRGSKLEQGRLSKGEALRRHASLKIQERLAAEEQEARVAVAQLKAQAAALQAARDEARGRVSCADAKKKKRQPVPEKPKKKEVAALATKTKKESIWKHAETASVHPNQTGGGSLGNGSGGTGSNVNNGLAATAALEASGSLLPPTEELRVVVFERGPSLGFTLCNVHVHGASMGWSYHSENSDGSNDNGNDDDNHSMASATTSGGNGGDGGGGEVCAWSACVLELDLSMGGVSAASELGVRPGDLLVGINGFDDLRGLRFLDVCKLLGNSKFPRTLTFRRRLLEGPMQPQAPEGAPSAAVALLGFSAPPTKQQDGGTCVSSLVGLCEDLASGSRLDCGAAELL